MMTKPGYIKLTAELELGTKKIIRLEGKTSREFLRIRRITFKVPTPNFGFLNGIWFDDLNAIIGMMDMFVLNPSADCNLEMPILMREKTIVIDGIYTGFVPVNYKSGNNYQLDIYLQEANRLSDCQYAGI